MLNDYPYDDNLNEYDESKGNGSFKRKLSDDMMSDDNEEQPNSPSSKSTNNINEKNKTMSILAGLS